jgi:type II secretory pathway pseudopilin PulG
LIVTIALIIVSLLCTVLLIALGGFVALRLAEKQKQRYAERTEARDRRKRLGFRR